MNLQALSSFIWSVADLLRAAGNIRLYNTSPLERVKLLGDQDCASLRLDLGFLHSLLRQSHAFPNSSFFAR